MSDNRAEKLAQIAQEIENLTESPLYEYRTENDYKIVPGEGSPHANIVFIGEAPGKQEAETGRPFIGAAGSVLDELLESVGLVREDVYITSVIKDRPPKNRDPRAAEIKLYSPFLERQLDVIRPDVIVTLGRFAMDFALKLFDMPEKGQKIGDLHGKTLSAQAPYGEIAVVPLYHPAAIFYRGDLRATLEEDFQVLKAFAREE